MRFLLGLFLIIIASPLTLWAAESQTLVKDFENGNLLVGEIVVEESLTCPGSESECLYLKTKTEKQVLKEQVMCGDLSSDVRVIEPVEQRCDEYGNCESCHRVEVESWSPVGEVSTSADISIGGDKVSISSSDKLFGSETTVVTEGEFRKTITVLEVTGDLTVVESKDSNKRTISNMDYNRTLAAVVQFEKSSAWGLRFFSLLLMIGGFFLLTSQFATPIIGVFRAIPFLGGILNTGAQGLVYFAMALIAFIVWLVLFLVVNVVTNLLVLLIVAAAIGGGLYLKSKETKK